MIQLLHGDCLNSMSKIADGSVDSIVTDPPYELGFMGKTWDSTGIANNVEMWKECLRVLKPGGHLLAFSGSRTYHRMVCAVEDAGFEIRDQIMWLYGSGFPKSMDVSKAIDKAFGVDREVVGSKIGKGGENLNILSHEGAGDKENSKGCGAYGLGAKQISIEIPVTVPSTDEAKQWNGWGTALKPAHEPIVVARKPLIGTVAQNVLTHGTGAINIDDCRVPGEPVPINKLEKWSGFGEEKRPDYEATVNDKGRFPANVVHDGSDEVMYAFPEAPGQLADVKRADEFKTKGIYGQMKREGENTSSKRYTNDGSTNFAMLPGARRLDKGSAARFFYCAKANKKDREEGNIHPTVKPTELMQYLCRLVTQPNGVVLDPFMGSGSTGKAAIKEGMGFIGIERDEAYFKIAEQRIYAAEADREAARMDALFGDEEIQTIVQKMDTDRVSFAPASV